MSKENQDSPWTIKMEQQEFTDHLLKSTIDGYNLALDDVLKEGLPSINRGYILIKKSKIEGLKK